MMEKQADSLAVEIIAKGRADLRKFPPFSSKKNSIDINLPVSFLKIFPEKKGKKKVIPNETDSPTPEKNLLLDPPLLEDIHLFSELIISIEHHLLAIPF